MSWHYSQALVEEYSEGICSDGEQSAPSSGNLTQPVFSSVDKTTVFSRRSLSGMTFRRLTENHGEAVLMSFLEAFPVRTLAAPEKEQGSTVNAHLCGHTWRESLVKFDLKRSTWKTHLCLWEEDLQESLVTLPKWGIMRDGELSELIKSELNTSETDSGSWPTPQRVDYKGTTSGSNFQQRADQFRCWSNGDDVTGTIYPNPITYESLMGFPLGWTELKPLGTDKFQQWLHSHGQSSQKGAT